MSLQIQAEAELELRRRARKVTADEEGLMDFVSRVSPGFERPEHLSPLVEALQRTRQGEVWAHVHAPPRHAKTETILHGIAWLLTQDPTLKIGFASYSLKLARRKSRRCLALATRAGVKMDPRQQAADEWATEAGGGMFAAGRGGPFTGEGFDLIVIDDPFKNRAEAESKLIRDGAHEWYTSSVVTRLEPNGSLIVAHTRWHEDDLIGRLMDEDDQDWEPICLKAMNDDGTALWESRWPAALLEKRRKRILEMDWWSLFQGSPRPRGGALFKAASFYRELPDGVRHGGGLDFAYTVKTRSDWNVLVEGVSKKGVVYVTHVEREQVKSHEWRDILKVRRRKNRHAPWMAYVSGVEKGIIDLLNDEAGLDITAVNASTDKFQRAQPAATGWNTGRILVPEPYDEETKVGIDAPWLSDLLTEVIGFSGVNDRRDDQVDGLAGLWEALIGCAEGVPDALDSTVFEIDNQWDI